MPIMQPIPGNFGGNYSRSIKIRILNIFLTESNGNVQQYRNTMDFNLTPSTTEAVLNRFDGGAAGRKERFNDIAGDLITWRTDNQFSEKVPIVNGWNERRFHFCINVEVTDYTGIVTEKIISGVTDIPDYVMKNSQPILDPNMTFYIDNIIDLSARINSGNARVTRNNQIIYDETFQSGSIHQADKNLKLLRPVDAITGVLQDRWTSQINSIASDTIVKRAASASDRKNAIPSVYLDKILTNYNDSIEDRYNDIAQNSDADIIGGAMARASEIDLRDDKFLSVLMNQYGFNRIGGVFTWRDLTHADEHCPEVVSIFTNEGAFRDHSGDTQGLYFNPMEADEMVGTSLHAEIAAKIAQILPGICVSYGVVGMAFTATNLNPGMNNHDLAFLDIRCINEHADARMIADMLERPIEDYLLRNISKNNILDYSILVDFDLYGNTRLKIEVDDGYGMTMIPYCIPTVCDNMFTPMATNNNQNREHFISQVDYLFAEYANQYKARLPVVPTNTDRATETKSLVYDGNRSDNAIKSPRPGVSIFDDPVDRDPKASIFN